MQNLVVLISGRGSNMVAIAHACERERWPARIAAVVSNRADAEGLETARRMGLPCRVLPSKGRADREAYDRELADLVDAFSPSLVVLAGYMRILSEPFVRHYSGRLINIHPSLLPAFPGLDTHRRALAAGVRVHGATVHLVTPALDDGPVVAQSVVPVLDDDDEPRLAARVLRTEHVIYPAAVRWWVEQRLTVQGTRVRLRSPAPGESQLLVATAESAS